MNIENKFNSIQNKNPLYSSYTSFASAITGSKISEIEMHGLFYKLVEKGDYRKSETEDILLHLDKLLTPQKV